jgi:hypothetical protein
MAISAGDFLDRFIRYGWVINLLVFYFMWLSWRVLEWFMLLKDPTPTQAGIIGLVLGILPSLGALLTFAIGRTAAPGQQPPQ